MSVTIDIYGYTQTTGVPEAYSVLKGSHPVVYGEQVAWIEWGEEMGCTKPSCGKAHLDF